MWSAYFFINQFLGAGRGASSKVLLPLPFSAPKAERILASDASPAKSLRYPSPRLGFFFAT